MTGEESHLPCQLEIQSPNLVAFQVRFIFGHFWWHLLICGGIFITFYNRQNPWGAAGQSDVSLINIMHSFFFHRYDSTIFLLTNIDQGDAMFDAESEPLEVRNIKKTSLWSESYPIEIRNKYDS